MPTVAGTEVAGTSIGPYRLIEQLGEGGFGVVHLAEQTAPVRRLVALKVLKPGMDSAAVLGRFEAERQALALMDHPGICKVLDAGATPKGLPYFAMELVRGSPITEYCDLHRLDTPERLKLFMSVCLAVHHAHQKGVIHRDLKPSNILVAVQDGQPAVKVIDFGIAKATRGSLGTSSVHTMMGQFIGTPEYMSPEQAEGSLDIDTRTDVYSLGVLLYELLTGSTPFSSKDLRSAAYAEIQRIIREVEPPKPSTRISNSTATIESVAARRHTEPKKLGMLIRGELDWIVMRSLEKDRRRRYETASGLAMDIQRYLAGEAVVAAPPSKAYVIKKFVHRHRGPVAAASVILTALILGLVGTAYGLRKEALAKQVAQREAERAQKAEAEAMARADDLKVVSDFQSGMLEQIEPSEAGKKLTQDVLAKFAAAIAKSDPPVDEAERAKLIESFTSQWARVNATDAARELIDQTILRPAITTIDERFKEQPAIDAQLRYALGSRYRHLGLSDRALPLMTVALETRRRVHGDDHEATINSMEGLASVLQDLGRMDEAAKYFKEAMERRVRTMGEDERRALMSVSNLGNVYRAMGRFDEARPLLESSLEKHRRLHGNESTNTLIAINSLGFLYVLEKKFPEAEALWREAYETGRRVLGDENRDVIVWANNLSALLENLRKFAESEPLRRDTLERARRLMGEEHPDTLSIVRNMGLLLQNMERFAEAEPYYLQTLEIRRRVLSPDHPDLVESLSDLGALMSRQQRYAEAETFYQEALVHRRRVAPSSDRDVIRAATEVAKVVEKLGRSTEGDRLWDEVISTLRSTRPAGSMELAAALMEHGQVLVDRKSWSQAEAELTECVSIVEAAQPNAWSTAWAKSMLGAALNSAKKYQEAEAMLMAGYEGLSKNEAIIPPRHKYRVNEAVERLITHYADRGDEAKTAEWRDLLAQREAAAKAK